MRRILTTLFGVVAIAIIIFTTAQAQNIGSSWMFTVAGILMIIGIAITVIRVWLRG